MYQTDSDIGKLLFTTLYQEELWCHFTDPQKGTGLNNLLIARTHCLLFYGYCSFQALYGQSLIETPGPASGGPPGQPRVERVSGCARALSVGIRGLAPRSQGRRLGGGLFLASPLAHTPLPVTAGQAPPPGRCRSGRFQAMLMRGWSPPPIGRPRRR